MLSDVGNAAGAAGTVDWLRGGFADVSTRIRFTAVVVIGEYKGTIRSVCSRNSSAYASCW